MTYYHNFLGIDIGKFNFFVSTFYDNNKAVEYKNTPEGINSFLARYGYERREYLELFKANSKNANKLYQLVARRADLTKALVAEKNRYQSPGEEAIKDSCAIMIKHLQAEIDALGAKIEELIENDEEYRYKRKILQEIPGVGTAVATDILALVPELGEINRRQIASLTGLAPIAKDSGTYRGYRRVNHGRSNLKPSLFLAAMGARKCKNNSYLKEFYERLIDESGKKKMVALTAVMRKIIIIANAKIKNAKLAQNHS